MNKSTDCSRLLLVLYNLSKASVIIDVFTLSRDTGLDFFRVLKAVSLLDHHGLADRRSLRLTLRGLVVAAGLCRRTPAQMRGLSLVAHGSAPELKSVASKAKTREAIARRGARAA